MVLIDSSHRIARRAAERNPIWMMNDARLNDPDSHASRATSQVGGQAGQAGRVYARVQPWLGATNWLAN